MIRAVRDLPAGTVTFLFTDIEGSTALLHELGAEQYAEALAEHRRVLRAAFEAHGGVEVDTQGDAFFVAFPDAGEALLAARESQEALAGDAIRVRMGLHTGEPLLAGEGYVGVDVHKAARICSAGHGGQILLSERTKLAVADGDLQPLGAHRLKDLLAPEPLYQWGAAGFPPLKSLNQSNLPVQPTPFLGREKELGEVLALLRKENGRVLTLTGPGGSGKTRLAVQAAAEVVGEREHGVWWVGLQAVRNPALVLPTIGSTLGAKGPLAEHVADRRMLFLLDNLEQVVDSAPELGELLASCPNLTLLVTSREPLRLAAEQEYPVPPFVEQEAVGFFFSRARAVRPEFEDGGSVRAICDRLDHLPLALELAAARVKALTPAQILERLERSLPLLTGGARDAPERQRTLRATIGWSYDLLTPEEQLVFRSLSVFAGGTVLEAAEQICGADLDTMQSLVEKSLVRFDEERYSLLETIREFASEQLAESDEAEELARRHAEYFLTFAEAANMAAENDYGRDYDVLPREQDNLRAAIDRAQAVGDVELALLIAIALENFWVMSDPFEGMRRFEPLLAEADHLEPLLRARALRCYGGSCHMSGNYELARGAFEESLELFRAAGDDFGVAVLLHRIGVSKLVTGETGARELFEESLVLFRRLGSRRGEGETIGSLGYLEMKEGNPEKAIELFEESAAIVALVGFAWWEVNMREAVSEALVGLGRYEEAAANAREGLALAVRIHDRPNTVFLVAMLAVSAAATGWQARAGLLWGAIEAEVKRQPVGMWEAQRDELEAKIRVNGGHELERGLAEGRRLSFETAIDEALGGRVVSQVESPQ
jgi:predicted ATPase